MAMISLIIVDDEGELLDLARHFLEKSGDIRVETASSAHQALEMHRKRPYDAIVSDYQMPEMDGIEFLKGIRGGGDTTPFIILTGKGREQVAIEALNLGADFYLQKGGDPRALFTELENMVRKSVKNHHADRVFQEGEERLRISESLYRTIFETTGAALAILDEKGTILMANREIEPLLGYRPEELEGKIPWTSFVPPDGVPRFTEVFRLLHAESAAPVQPSEARLVDRWGKPRFGILSMMRIPHTENCVISVTDITDLRIADEKLRASETLYRTIFQTTGTATVILDENGTIVLANREVETILGFPPRELEGRIHWSSFVPPGELPRLAEFWRLLHEDPASSAQHYEAQFVDRWGHVKHGIVSIALIPGTKNCVASIMDITDQKKAGEALMESEVKYRTLVERATDGIAVIQDHTIVFCNTRAAEMAEGVPEDIVGREFMDFVDRDEVPRVLEIYRKALDENQPPRVHDILLRGKSGTRMHAGIHAGIASYRGKPAVLLFIRDITERKRNEDALLTAHKKLNLLSSITRHDIRNQLMVILGYTQILREETTDIAQARIIVAVENAARTIQHHIEFTKEYQEIGITAPAWQDLKEVIEQAGARLNPGKVRIEIELDGIELYADPLLERVFYNLIDNSLKHGHPLTRIRFSGEESPQGLTITCEDDGPGVPPENKERIFSPGFEGKSGYGLFLVREILGITGMSIHERGISGTGAVFRISVPRGVYRAHH